jgi:hypothetical protein
MLSDTHIEQTVLLMMDEEQAKLLEIIQAET